MDTGPHEPASVPDVVWVRLAALEAQLEVMTAHFERTHQQHSELFAAIGRFKKSLEESAEKDLDHVQLWCERLQDFVDEHLESHVLIGAQLATTELAIAALAEKVKELELRLENQEAPRSPSRH